MINTIFTTKDHMAQAFIKGKRVPVTVLKVENHKITQIKDLEKDGYQAVQIAVGQKNLDLNKPEAGHFKKANLKKAPRWTREVRVTEGEYQVGDELKLEDIITKGDTVKATGISIGKGFAGTIKRHGFHAQPRTHGQSDRRRAPGSIGRGTTPGRVLPGKKMAGHMGAVTTTVTGLKVTDVNTENSTITVSGPVPGPKTGLVTLTVTKKSPKKETE